MLICVLTCLPKPIWSTSASVQRVPVPGAACENEIHNSESILLHRLSLFLQQLLHGIFLRISHSFFSGPPTPRPPYISFIPRLPLPSPPPLPSRPAFLSNQLVRCTFLFPLPLSLLQVFPLTFFLPLTSLRARSLASLTPAEERGKGRSVPWGEGAHVRAFRGREGRKNENKVC